LSQFEQSQRWGERQAALAAKVRGKLPIRDKQVLVRLTKEEAARLNELAEAEEVSVQSFIRIRIFGGSHAHNRAG
jgi:hypothetical protein